MTPPSSPRPARAAVLIASALLALAPVLLAGCGPGDGRPARHPTTGKVSYRGKPLAGAFVLLVRTQPTADVPKPNAITDEDGSFVLTTYEDKDGAPEGDYVVTISTAPRPTERQVSLKKAEPHVDLLKGRYADPKNSGLKAEVKEGKNELAPFDLK